MSQTLQYLTNEYGERTAVVLPMTDYEKLMDDLDDLATMAERREEPVIPHEQFVAELKRDGAV
ncbi:MAG TPA: hypothetical protein VM165_17100 [Planctomycetaceae bacterium]|nr:hypothetical protein [Planctomycetaceae bacterium]